MGPKKKSNAGGNGFYYFMLEFKDRPGSKIKSMSEAAVAAGPHWNRLTAEQKAKYDAKARAFKNAMQATKQNCDNTPIEDVENSEREALSAKQQMKDDIQASLLFSKCSNTLTTQRFFFVHVNSFCQHEHTKKYSPCEIAIVAFSLEEGVYPENVYHSIIKPGPLPFGYASMAMKHSEETHQIDIPLNGRDAEDNQETIFKEIIAFLSSKKRGNDSSLPTLYAAEKHLPMVKAVFEMWCSDYGIEPKLFQIYNLQCMFKALRNIISPVENFWLSDTMSHQEIEKDVYCYTFEIACEYHQMADAVVFCSRSIAVRYAYIICDHCCQDVNIEHVPGRHIPLNARKSNVLEWETAKPSKKSVYSKSTSEGSIREDTTDAETVISLGKSSSGWGENSSVASINFPELKKPTRSNPSGNSFFDSKPRASGSYAGATSMRTGSTTGRGSDPTTYALSEDFGNLTTQDMDNHFPAIGSSKSRNFIYKGQGRGNPFKKQPPAS